jgi:hypothetical protein
MSTTTKNKGENVMMNMEYDYLVELIKEDPTTAIDKYSKKNNKSEEITKVEIFIREELLELMTDQIPEKERKSLGDWSNIIDISDVQIVDIYEDDHLPCTIVVFNDQDKQLRQTTIRWDEVAPGMIKYYQEAESIKNDLIESINRVFEFDREAYQ